MSISPEGLRIANATVDIMQRSGPQYSLAFARRFRDEPAVAAATFATSDAVIVGHDLIGSLQLMARRLTITPVEEVSPALRRAVTDPALRAALDRAFVAACHSVFPAQDRAMVVGAWHELLTAFLAALDAR